jgi:membrane associated rhomboid family serine protease
VFPIRDDNPHFTTPVATYGLIGLNLIAWVLLQGLGTEPALSASVFDYGLVPARVLGPDGGWHTVITSMFLHGGWMHLIGNMWFLWIFGNNVEDAMGHVRFVVFYLLCGIAAAGLQTAFSPGSTIPMVGASGAIGGVMGAYVLMYPRVHVHLFVILGFYVNTIAVPAYFMLGYWFLLQVVSGSMAVGAEGGGVAFWAHVGGFAAGALLSFVFRDREMLARHPYYGWKQRSPTNNWTSVGRRGRDR